jgi:hypothetical protein
MRGSSCPVLLGREAMASLLAACRKNFSAAYGLHARAKPVRLGSASLARLICALWQNNPPSVVRARFAVRHLVRRSLGKHTPAASAAHSELSSVLGLAQEGQESAGVGYKARKSDTPVGLSAVLI